jgi:hypothetical protein
MFRNFIIQFKRLLDTNHENVYFFSNPRLRGKGFNPFILSNKVFGRNTNQTENKDPLTIKGLIKRITLLPLNYTRYNAIIVYNWTFCPTGKLGIIKR